MKALCLSILNDGAIPKDYRDYYSAKRNNFFATIQGFREMWDYYVRLDAVWVLGFADLYVARDQNTMFPLLLYFNAHARFESQWNLLSRVA